MSDDLPGFLLARIAEDEEAARAAGRPEELYPYGDRRLNPFAAEKVPDAVRDYLGGTWGEHFARWPMPRVLAECEAKRRIVALHNPCDDWSYGDASTCPELVTLALPYDGHPEYREEWRP